MLYKFKSKAAGDVIMLQANGQALLEIIGKHSPSEPSLKGILLPEQMSLALAALQKAIALEDAQRQQVIAQAKTENSSAPRFETIALRQRALPLMDMIRRCAQANQAITWGV
jgi:flagellar biosynthesis/type III secretory pathway chaperone